MCNYISKHMFELHNKNHAKVCGDTVEETSAQYVDLSKIDIPVVLRQREEIEIDYISTGACIHFRPAFTKANLRSLLYNDNDIFPDSRCETHWHTLFINHQGKITPLPQCILKPVGNVHKQNLLDIWNGEKMREQRLKLREYGAYYGCMRCWSICSNIEDMQGTWYDNTDGIKAGARQNNHSGLA